MISLKQEFQETLEPTQTTPYYYINRLANQFKRILELVDLPERDGRGRPAKIPDYDLLAIIVFSQLNGFNRNLKATYNWLVLYHKDDFDLPTYGNFVKQYNRLASIIEALLEQTLAEDEYILLIDSTPIKLCELSRSYRLRTMSEYASITYGSQGQSYGLKLHATCSLDQVLAGYQVTTGKIHDKGPAVNLVRPTTKILVGDTHYGAYTLRRQLLKLYKCSVIAPAHPKQTNKLVDQNYFKTYRLRKRIETAFSVLKDKFNLVSTKPRSVLGYARHYLTALFCYQIYRLSQLATT